MAECIIMGSGGGGVGSDEVTARAADVLSGKTYLGADTDDEAGVGTMPNRGAMQRTLRAGESVTVPQGYHNGSGTVSAASLAEQTAGSAGAGDILAGKRVDGSIPVFNTMGPHGIDPRGSLTTEYGIDLNAHTLWMHAPAHNAYYMREDGYPHICMDSGALGDATAQQVLQGCTFTSEHGMKTQGAMYRWPISGDIGGQRVMDAHEHTVFAGDYGARGRGVFMRMPGGSQIDPTGMWAWAPAPTVLPQNIRAGVSVLGVWGSMVDYAATCVPFDGARFDGVHLSGWATGTLGGVPLQARDTVTQPMPWNNAWKDEFNWGWALTASVALAPFREVRVTIRTDAPNSTDQWWQSTRLYLVRPGGSPHNRPLNAIRQQSSARTGFQTISIPTADITEQAFIAVHLSVGSLRARSAGNVFSARIERVELIA